MTKYVVLKAFRDRFDNMRICQPGEPHDPPTAERAEQLVTLGFIKAVPATPTGQDPAPDDEVHDTHQVEAPDKDADEEGIKHVGGGYWELPDGQKVRGKEKAWEVLQALKAGSDR